MENRRHQPGSWDEMPKRDYAEGHVRWHEMPNLERAFKAGKQVALMLAVHKCAQRGQPLPAWAATAFSEGFGRVYRGEARSWTDVFGPANKGKHFDTVERRRLLMLAICDRMKNRTDDDPSVSNDLFNKIAEELGVSRKRVSELYYEGKGINDFVRNPDAPSEADAIVDGDLILNLLNDPDPLLDQDDPELPRRFLPKPRKKRVNTRR
jgi:hypothetical protein